MMMDEGNPNRRIEPLSRNTSQELGHFRKLLLADDAMAWCIGVLLLNVLRRIEAKDDRADIIDAVMERVPFGRITWPEICIESLVMKIGPWRPSLFNCLFCKCQVVVPWN